MHRRVRFFASRFALLAFVLAALAPAVSRAIGGSAAPVWAEVCRSEGDRRAPALMHALEHCAYCGTQATPLALPPAGGATAALLRFAHERPRARAVVAVAPPPWQLALARAPPGIA